MSSKEKGFTLAEILASLVITGLVITTAARTLTAQHRLTRDGDVRIELQQAGRSALSLVEKEIRQAKSAVLVKPGVLQLTRVNGQLIKFYVADKDYNGINDFYLETNGVPNPVVSYVDKVEFADLAQGKKWWICVTARRNGVEEKWFLTVNIRAE